MSKAQNEINRASVVRDLLIDNWQLAPLPQIYTEEEDEAFQNRYDRGDLIAISENLPEDFGEPEGNFAYRDHDYKFTIEIVTQARGDVIKWKDHIYDLLHENRDRPYNGDYKYWQYIQFTNGTDESKPKKMLMKMNYIMKSYQDKIKD